ncbi:ligand-binding SRPBCC domain protein [Tistrella bauzanensis]|uniref:Ligand-binding SRPBCC domain protein n=1 Tax=Tistrella bauzanensis TaxID=657419 RepID=A0ABQ1J802_9PROT|nr:SRPBCC domain-containing protein [Tistrella bauzanensis]GGB62246.1 ligand-binding SRPBCC domain protein [Tistrella bauzanensis]
MSGSEILIALRIQAPAAQVFRAFVEDIGLWWQPSGLFQFTAGPPGRLAFDPPGAGGRLVERKSDGSVFDIGHITDWQPPARLAFTWRQASFSPDQTTHVTVSFEAVGDQTRVSLRHRGWDTIPIRHAARHNFPDAVFLHRHGGFWRQQMQALAQRLAMADTGGRPS